MNPNGPSTSPAPIRLRRPRIHAVGIVDEAANGWDWLAIQKSLRKNGGPMDAASGAAGAAANGANAGATTKALQLPPNTKNVVMQMLASAMEGLSTIQTALQDAEEAESAPMPAELLGAIEQSGMELVAFAQQHGSNADAGGEAVSMSTQEVEVANALVDAAPDIVKSLFVNTVKASGDGVKKASLKVAPAQVVSLIKELLDDFVGRASKWGGLFSGDGVAAPAAAPEAVASNKKDAAATLKSVRDASAARVAKATTQNHVDDERILKALEDLQDVPALRAEVTRLRKSLVGGGNVDPADDFAALLEGDGQDGQTLKYAFGENISARVREEQRVAKTKRRAPRDEDDNDDEI